MRALCRVEDIADGGARGFPGALAALSAWWPSARGHSVYVYENSCPHIGTPLDWMPDQFMSADGQYIICATHGAEFAIR